MQTMELEPTDKRIDDLNSRMAEGFQRVHREIDGLNEQMAAGFKRVDGEINRLDGDIRELRGASRISVAEPARGSTRCTGR
jgi:hypothetical protein